MRMSKIKEMQLDARMPCSLGRESAVGTLTSELLGDYHSHDGVSGYFTE